MVSPYSAAFTKYNDAEYNDDDDFFPRDQKQQFAFQNVIKDKCLLNQKERGYSWRAFLISMLMN